MYAIAVDTGKSFSKSISYKDQGFIKQRFRTLMQEGTHVSGVEVSGDTYRVEFEDKQYLIGSMCSELNADYASASKHSLTHKLAVYTSIALMLEKLSVERVGIPQVAVALNTPLHIFKNEKLKAAYHEFILNDQKPISLRVNGQAWVFRINQLVLLPESLGPIYYHLNEYRNSRVTVIDIGSMNASFSTFDRLIPKIDSMVISNLGVNLLRGHVQETLSTQFGATITLDESEAILREQVYSINGTVMPESERIIRDLMTNHVRDIINFGRSQGLSFTTPVFCGGGSLLLKDAILAQYPHAQIDDNGSYSNVMSYWKLLEARGLTSHV